MPEDAAVVGRVVANRYLIEAPCERSASVSVYRAQHLGNDRPLLLRVLPACPGVSREACRDALALAERAAALATPHVARTLDVGVVADRWPFVVSEYTRGKTLASLLAHEGALDVRRALSIARQVASALAVAHRSRLTHGELAASGLWLEAPGGRREWVRLLDFGLSELDDRSFPTTQSGVFPSTPQLGTSDGFGPASVRDDVQALGALLAELASGAPLEPGCRDVMSRLPAPPPSSEAGPERGLGRAFASLVERCLGLRGSPHASMLEICADLQALEESCSSGRSELPITVIHMPARRAAVAVGGPKVIVRGG